MKKLILNILLFSGLTAIVYAMLVFVLFQIPMSGTPLLYRATHGLQWKGGPALRVFEQFDKTEKRDIIIIGTSHAYRGYNPDIFLEHGLKMRALATSSQSLKSSYVVAKSLVNKNNCDIVFIDLYERIFSSSSLESTADLVQHLPDNKSALAMAWEAKDIRAVNMFATRLASKNSPALFDSEVEMKNGFGTSHDTISFPLKKRYYDYQYQTRPEQFEYLKKLVRHLQKEGVQVVLTECPLPYFVNDYNHKQFLNDLQPVLEELNVPFYNYAYNSGLNEIGMFYDDNHLNHAGVILYNKQLIKDLQKDGILN